MSLQLDIFIDLIPQLILFFVVLVLSILGPFSKKITDKFAFLRTRMRIIYGYIVVITSAISYITFFYILQPFNENVEVFLHLRLQLFSVQRYAPLSGTLMAEGVRLLT